MQALVGAEERLRLVAADLVSHFENRIAALEGKAMIVCMSRAICVKLYDQIVALRPDWHSPDDNAGKLKIVMTGSAADPPEWQPHIGNKARRDRLAKRLKDPEDPLQLVIVRDMWLTGFDAPSLHTMYVDKPMQGHGLMQAIARYHTNAISTVEVLQELIDLARDIKAARQRGEEQGLSADEIAFYDALAENESAAEVMGNDQLKVIAHELLMSLKSNITVDWAHREIARADLRRTIKRILRKYGYPPDLQAAAVQTVLQQEEGFAHVSR
ncbi:type I restriction enzyme endonuclease domain-containing protein [Leptodesmis sp.]|uniref:type I restriction enzyme endonuclease domain-containing protein n=1 Tax=Leptodesmis sp. TaxID=3100501 RepID=UPI004053582A